MENLTATLPKNCKLAEGENGKQGKRKGRGKTSCNLSINYLNIVYTSFLQLTYFTNIYFTNPNTYPPKYEVFLKKEKPPNI